MNRTIDTYQEKLQPLIKSCKHTNRISHPAIAIFFFFWEQDTGSANLKTYSYILKLGLTYLDEAWTQLLVYYTSQVRAPKNLSSRFDIEFKSLMLRSAWLASLNEWLHLDVTRETDLRCALAILVFLILQQVNWRVFEEIKILIILQS